MLRDIRELTDSPDAYAAELRRRWGGLLSYRYIGRSYASMDLGPEDNTVTVRRDMRNGAGGLLLAVLGIASPEGGSSAPDYKTSPESMKANSQFNCAQISIP